MLNCLEFAVTHPLVQCRTRGFARADTQVCPYNTAVFST
jgi:hypothetical protein